ncbi:MAG TPA: RNA polymerase sigma factor [candidate division Zixibacteria bacterium]|nr:RNA polymerase sigma factor [candidate division Zixibacteria bacterium]MDD4917776.1 RNA polymerase sigma factor [candidate division Zixibacteria bacterium]MDM7971893.1 RNA polymerase sigma factor [candidate division Zixibacteria bacterium]HOD66966.1 RNA polymerase sigma factor [candidate division Zixibacteria bacterium]HOZ08248.1 RNA polymerase sigma factor [candidate division Zixibacteria bacterium]
MEHERFWQLLEPEHAKAQRFCRRLTGSIDDGDDLYQDGLLAALRRFDSLRDPGAFRAWLYRILVNRYRNRHRWRRRQRTEALDDEVMTGPAHDPAGELAARRWLDRALAALRPEERALVVLFELEGWTITELAANLGRPEGTIKARLARARRKMRRRIQTYLPPKTTNPLPGKAGYALSQDQD